MLRKAYIVIVNALLFYFIVAIINGVHIHNNELISVILAALVFGVLMMAVAFVLKFFKISVNFWSKLLVSVVLAFAFFFLIYEGILGIGSIGSSVINLGLGSGPLAQFDALTTLIVVSLVSGLGSVGLDLLSKA